MSRDRVNVAVFVLAEHLRKLYDKAGIPWTEDDDRTIRRVLDLTIDQAVEEARNEKEQ